MHADWSETFFDRAETKSFLFLNVTYILELDSIIRYKLLLLLFHVINLDLNFVLYLWRTQPFFQLFLAQHKKYICDVQMKKEADPRDSLF